MTTSTELCIRATALSIVLLASGCPVIGDEPFIAAFDRFYSGIEAPDSQQTDIQGGQLLLTELNCTACHADEGAPAASRGPVLERVLLRIQREWIRQFLLKPDASKPGTLMPDVLHEVPQELRERRIEALLAFLSDDISGQPVEPVLTANALIPIPDEFWRKGDAERGQTLYHQVGCVACHAIDKQLEPTGVGLSDLEQQIRKLQLTAEELEEYGLVLPQPVRPVPHSDLAIKYSQRSLSMFLIEPSLVHPAGRMPSLRLTPMEAADIAAYLFRSRSGMVPIAEIRPLEQPSAELIAEGKRLYGELRCANCHTHRQVTPVMARSLSDLRWQLHGEYCTGRGRGTPRYSLSDAQTAAIQTVLQPLTVGTGTSSRTKPASRVDLTLLQMNCFACHQRAGKGGPGSEQWPFFQNIQYVDIGDEGRIPPTLDRVGWKLKTPWLQKVIEGQAQVRPHFRVRMPSFPKIAESTAVGLREADHPAEGDSLLTAPEAPAGSGDQWAAAATAAELDAGRHLFNLGCVQCHSIRGESLPGVVGVDVSNPSQRFNAAWFREFLLNPGAFRKNTRMPTFFPQGRSADPTILDGDVERQIASLWKYLNSPLHPLPEKLQLARQEDFELIPEDTAIILRTFMESDSAGTRAIAVGFPQKIHFSFDADSARPAEIWKGRFLNSYGTWFDRFAPPAIPLGHQRILLPAGVWWNSAPVITEEPHQDEPRLALPEFQGYRVDSAGVPTFLYRIDGLQIEDQMMPIDSETFRRTLTFRTTDEHSSRPVLWMSVIRDVAAFDSNVSDESNRSDATQESLSRTTKSRLRATVSGASDSRVVQRNQSTEWMVAITIQQRVAKLEVIYQW